MLHRLAVLVVLLLGLGAAPALADAPPPLTIYVTNTSSNVTDASVVDALPAFSEAGNQDFAPVWSTPQIDLVLTDTPPAGAWTIALSDYSDTLGAAGYHEVQNGVPVAKVFTQSGVNWQLVFTHELFEMLADPHIDRATYVNEGSVFYALEVSDPVENQRYSYTRPSATGQPVVISDFVTENWFSGQGGAKLDFTGYVKHAHRILSGGYIYKFQNGTWSGGLREFRLPSTAVGILWE